MRKLITELEAWKSKNKFTMDTVDVMELDGILSRAKAEAQSGEGGLGISEVEFPCPTCGEQRFKTERRINGDSWCRNGHKHPTKEFVPKPSSPKESLAERLIKAAGGNAGFHIHQWEDRTWELECAAHIFKGSTYAICEAKAVAYLNSLPDSAKEGKDKEVK